jgi:sec-independent protein translocase protein TatC
MIDAPVRVAPGVHEDDDPPMPFSAHLVELRERLIWSLVILGAGAAVTFQFAKPFLDWLARPVGALVFIAPAEAFHTRFKLAFYGGFLLTLPLLLHQVWLFVSRAFSREWRQRMLTMVPVSYALFMAGVLLCLYAIVPAAVKFFLSYGSEGVKPLITLNAYLSFVTTLSLAFGAAFQFPLVLYTLNWMGVLEKESVKPQRRLIWFAAFVFPAFFTPDIIGQCSLAACLILMFELTLLVMK